MSASKIATGCNRALRMRSASPSRSQTNLVPSDFGPKTPARVMVARLRTIAVIGNCGNSAFQTPGKFNASEGNASHGQFVFGHSANRIGRAQTAIGLRFGLQLVERPINGGNSPVAP